MPGYRQVGGPSSAPGPPDSADLSPPDLNLDHEAELGSGATVLVGRRAVLPAEVEGARITGPTHSPSTPPTYSAGRVVVIPEGRLLTASGGKPERRGLKHQGRVVGTGGLPGITKREG